MKYYILKCKDYVIYRLMIALQGISYRLFHGLGKIHGGSVWADRMYLRMLFRLRMHTKLHLDPPQTFNEKLQWLKLYDHKPEYTQMADKYEMKSYVSSKIGEGYTVPVLGVWEHFDEIDFDSLPDQFVLKCTHNSGGVVICRDKKQFNRKKTRKKIEQGLKKNYYYNSLEWPYRDIKPRILAEQYMVDESGYELKDYKLMCFNGKVRCTFACSQRGSRDGLCINTYDRDWNPMSFGREKVRNSEELPKPSCYDRMVELAEILSDGIPFIRVDFYQINGKPYIGELTFFPASGMKRFDPESWDTIMGDWLQLPTFERSENKPSVKY